MTRCELCGEHTADPLGHWRNLHPDVWDQEPRWPDGGIVIEPDEEDE